VKKSVFIRVHSWLNFFVTIITDETCTGYARAGHPERPQRITATAELLKRQTELELTWAAPCARPARTPRSAGGF
jgi:hypothetical protein